jgi:lipoprotein-releasing system permease protein
VVFLIVVVAAFGIANVLTLAVFEKTQEIAILRAVGATRALITRVFLLEGLILGLGGLLLGNLLGLGISAYFTVRPFQLPGDLYFITALPVEVRLTDLLGVNTLGLVTTLLAALIPARRAANIEPARIIR